ncbi:MAG: hypothetical protein AAB363_06035, partial [Planctomycetota bacterium]
MAHPLRGLIRSWTTRILELQSVTASWLSSPSGAPTRRSDEASDDSPKINGGVGNGRRFPTQVSGGPGLPGGPSNPDQVQRLFSQP